MFGSWSRPECVEELHQQAQLNLQSLLQGKDGLKGGEGSWMDRGSECVWASRWERCGGRSGGSLASVYMCAVWHCVDMGVLATSDVCVCYHADMIRERACE